jgi:hypothetical protein
MSPAGSKVSKKSKSIKQPHTPHPLHLQDVMVGGLPEKLDAVFLVDGSGSISETVDFAETKELVKMVVMKMNIEQDKASATVR